MEFGWTPAVAKKTVSKRKRLFVRQLEETLCLIRIRRREMKMSAWKNVRNLLLAGVCASCFLWTYESEAAGRRSDNRSVKGTTNRRNKKRKPVQSQSGIPQKEVVLRSSDKVLSELIASAHHTNMNGNYKKVLIEALNLIAKTLRGKWILRNIPPHVKFSEFPEKGAANKKISSWR